MICWEDLEVTEVKRLQYYSSVRRMENDRKSREVS